MTFEEMLEQAMAMLRRHKRVTYQALRRQFDLDETSFADLTDAILYAYPQVVEEDGHGLAWTEAAPPAEGNESRLDAVLPELIGLLQRRGRVTYRTLTQIFGLDAALLHALRDELLFQRLAVDEDGKGLVWAAAVTSLASPRRSLVAPLPEASLPAGAVEVSRLARGALEAERRQVTVLFCDLVDSTRLSQQLDAEDYRAVVRTYQEATVAALHPYDGYVAQFLGDGVLVYFGWPTAHEDAAARAVYASLAIIEALQPLNDTRLAPQYAVRVQVRLGLHTGMAVIGEMGGGDRHEQLAMGDTPNIAARLQALAQPNTVVLSAATARLVQGIFTLEDLGLHYLKGVTEPLGVARLIGAIAAPGEADELTSPAGPFLVGRDEEIGLLVRRWEQSKAGLGQVVLLSGEAGIGKSALVQALHTHVSEAEVRRFAFRCSPYHTNSTLYPVINLVQQVLRFAHEDTAETRLAKLEQGLHRYRLPLAEVVPLFTALLSLPLPDGRYPALTLTPQRQRQQTQDALVGWLMAEAEQHPLLAVWQDLHWADPSTLELLGLLIDQVPTVPMLHVLAFRPEFTPPWPARSHLTPITLNRLERPQVEALIAHLAGGKALPGEVVEHIVAKTDGVPLFVEELTKMVLESGLLQEEAEHYRLTGSLSTVTIPATLQDSLMARLDRLPQAREIAQLGAVLGREFAYELLQAVAPQDEATLQAGLAQLVAAELLYQRGRPPRARYLFKHALIQDAAYASLLRSTRQQVHQQVAQLLETRFPEAVETQPELVAQHYTEAGCHEQAVVYWQRAGQQASERSAHVEAISHLTIGIELLKTLLETPEHTQQALALHIALGAALLMTKGQAAPEVEHTYIQARALCQRMGETPELAPVLLGLWRFYVARPQLHTARDIGETLLRQAQCAHDPALAVIADYALGNTWFYLGVLPAARQHLETGIALYTPDQRRAPVFRIGHDPGVACRANAAQTFWLLGYPEQALARLHEALALAHELSHPYSLAYARCWAAIASQLRRDVSAVHELAEAAVALSTEQGFTLFSAMGKSLRGWALAIQGQGAEGLAQIRQGITAWQATGAALYVPYLCTVLADVCDHLGHTEDGLQVLAEAHTLVEQHEERWWEAEISRLRGVLLLRQPETPQAEAEAWLQRALDVARRQEAKSLELRAAMSLSRLWQQQGKRRAAHALLAEVYAWFTEGFDTADLQEARVLLDTLA
jgi:predicted ATPase/class 3 adenylate cyclase